MAADTRTRTLTTADLPDGFRVEPDDARTAALGRRAGLAAACGHDECLAAAVRRLLSAEVVASPR